LPSRFQAHRRCVPPITTTIITTTASDLRDAQTDGPFWGPFFLRYDTLSTVFIDPQRGALGKAEAEARRMMAPKSVANRA
jgi:hypothetical protein